MKKINHDNNNEDIEIFHKAVEGTRPLIQTKIRLKSKEQKRLSLKPLLDDKEIFYFAENPTLKEVNGEDYIFYKNPNISNSIFNNLKKGQYPIDAKLDLHTMSVEEARLAITIFLKESLARGIRVGLIIHGKGKHGQKPILKNKLNHWLREFDVVLAFCSASAAHGNRGAIYILLKCITGENVF